MPINNFNDLLSFVKEDRKQISALINKSIIIKKDKKFLHHLVSILSPANTSENLEFLKQIDISFLKTIIQSVDELKMIVSTLEEKDQAFLLALLGRDHLRNLITMRDHISTVTSALSRTNYSLLSNMLGEVYLRNIYSDRDVV